MAKKMLRQTVSVCPVCLTRITARQMEEEESGGVWQEKSCPVHGDFSTVMWRGRLPIGQWRGDYPALDPNEAPLCPTACGLCKDHQQKTCCVVLEVTGRCNLHCEFCFAGGGDTVEADPGFHDLCGQIKELSDGGRTLLQLSGGEPTLRDDLPQLVRAAKQAGCKYVQLNTNGLRIARDKEYLHALAEAGLSFVFLQFDGTEDDIYIKLRGEALFAEKCRAIEACSLENIGVTLVPTLVPGVNTHALGDILRFGIAHSPAVRGVHFQPASYFGRIPMPPQDEERYLLDELICDLVEQSGGLVSLKDLTPSCCDHPLCGFHGDFVALSKDKLLSLGGKKAAGEQGCCCGESEEEQGCCRSEEKQNGCNNEIPGAADKNREFVGRRWQRPDEAELCGEDEFSGWDGGAMDMDAFLNRVKTHGFTVTSMAFQDAGNLDLERLRRCSLHVFKKGRFVPFCANYLSAWK